MVLLDDSDDLHINALEYFRFFLQEKITIHLSTIVVAECAVGNNRQNLPIDYVQIETFDFMVAATAGLLHAEFKKQENNITGYNRRIIANDVKILAQVKNRKIDAIISKDVQSHIEYVAPLIKSNLLNVRFI